MVAIEEDVFIPSDFALSLAHLAAAHRALRDLGGVGPSLDRLSVYSRLEHRSLPTVSRKDPAPSGLRFLHYTPLSLDPGMQSFWCAAGRAHEPKSREPEWWASSAALGTRKSNPPPGGEGSLCERRVTTSNIPLFRANASADSRYCLFGCGGYRKASSSGGPWPKAKTQAVVFNLPIRTDTMSPPQLHLDVFYCILTTAMRGG
jgi:hypothetical protein